MFEVGHVWVQLLSLLILNFRIFIHFALRLTFSWSLTRFLAALVNFERRDFTQFGQNSLVLRSPFESFDLGNWFLIGFLLLSFEYTNFILEIYTSRVVAVTWDFARHLSWLVVKTGVFEPELLHHLSNVLVERLSRL